MMNASPEGLNEPYDPVRDSFCDHKRQLQFVKASELYDVESGARTLWAWAAEATDEEVADAIAALEEGQR